MDSPAPGVRKLTEEDFRCNDKDRFVIELEFVQCLANPHYLNWLGQNGHLENPAFINYLKYLLYWKQPQYAKHITYPHSLYFLDLLQDENFRERIKDDSYRELVHSQQYFYWKHFRTNRVKAAEPS